MASAPEQVQVRLPVAPTAASPAATVPSMASAPAESPDRAAIGQAVANVLSARGIARGSAAKVSGTPAIAAGMSGLPKPAEIAAEVAARVFGPAKSAEKEPAPPAKSKPASEISAFVSENDVRRALTRSEKIFIGPKTILTPSARDLGMEHEVFVEADASPAK